MLTRVYSAALHGVDAIEVEIEVDERRSRVFQQVIVGLPDAAVRESKDRVLTAIANSKLSWPQGTYHHQPRACQPQEGGAEF
ncbi:MAG: magnesium chelatase domain-containing protein [Verrucomicrobiota bacterium]